MREVLAMISVVIPTLNEAPQLPAALDHLRRQNEPAEVIVVDGGSTDETTIIARQFGATVIQSPTRQRAFQMNLGASSSRGETLLFLHADTRVPSGALFNITRVLKNSLVVGGGFARLYDSRSLSLKVTCLLAEVRTRMAGWFLGDQAIFVRRETFAALGGYENRDIFEDLDFSRRMARSGRVVTLRPPVLSDARRFAARGAVATTWRDFVLTMRYLRPRLFSPVPASNANASKSR
jgi:rSAM/selenodomain-associated transferase 2